MTGPNARCAARKPENSCGRHDSPAPAIICLGIWEPNVEAVRLSHRLHWRHSRDAGVDEIQLVAKRKAENVGSFASFALTTGISLPLIIHDRPAKG